MTTHLHAGYPDAASRRRGVLLAAGLALAMAFPSDAHPYDLKQLLQMPLEQLLALRITSRRVAVFPEQRSLGAADRAIEEGDHAP